MNTVESAISALRMAYERLQEAAAAVFGMLCMATWQCTAADELRIGLNCLLERIRQQIVRIYEVRHFMERLVA